MIRTALLTSAFLTMAAPALASQADAKTGPAMGPAFFTGTWEDPMPREILRPESTGLQEAPRPAADPPLKPEHLAKWKADQKADADAIARGEPPLSANAQCQPGGYPGMMSPFFPIEVLQTPGQVTITQEAYSQTRRIYLNEKQIALEDAEPTYYGHSVGHWEGDVLYVNTVGLKDFIRNRGMPHSDQMQIDEVIKVAPNRVDITLTQTDPVYLTKPYTWTIAWVKKPGYKMNEFVCENNRNYADPITGQQRLKTLD